MGSFDSNGVLMSKKTIATAMVAASIFAGGVSLGTASPASAATRSTSCATVLGVGTFKLSYRTAGPGLVQIQKAQFKAKAPRGFKLAAYRGEFQNPLMRGATVRAGTPVVLYGAWVIHTRGSQFGTNEHCFVTVVAG